MSHDRKPIDLTGMTFNELKVLKFAGISKGGRRTWRCICVCNKQIKVAGHSLRSGNTKSCGCRKIRATKERCTIHGHSLRGRHSPTYTSWANMVARCMNPKYTQWADYGGRGIKVCKRWLKFENFLSDMGERPSPELTLDRINNDEDYKPGNCRYATRSQQRINSRKIKTKYGIPYRGVRPGFFQGLFSGVYEASVKDQGKTIYLGRFPSAVMAALAFDGYQIKSNKTERLNFPTLKE